jgi:hypothetical protein
MDEKSVSHFVPSLSFGFVACGYGFKSPVRAARDTRRFAGTVFAEIAV